MTSKMLSLRKVVLLASLLATACGGSSSPSVYANQPWPGLQIPTRIESYMLPNGLEVVLNEDHHLPVVTVSTVYFVGMNDNPPGQIGIAHLFEHLMFQGSLHVGEGMFARYLERAGARYIVGRTEDERTVYAETVPASQLSLALWLESDRMAFLSDHVNAHTLEVHRRVIENEYQERFENTPYGNVGRFIEARTFPAHHAPDVPAAPELKLGKIGLTEIRRFGEMYYRPNNATLFVAGDFRADELREKITKYFGPIVPGSVQPDSSPLHPAVNPQGRLDIVASVPSVFVIMTWLTTRFGDEGDAELDVIAQFLMRGSLARRLTQELQIATEVSAHQLSKRTTGRFDVAILARRETKVETITREVNDAIEALRNKELSLDAIRIQTFPIILRLALSYQHPAERLERIARYSFLAGDPAFAQRDVTRYALMDPASVKRAVERFLRPEGGLVTVVTPQEGAPAGGRLVSSR